VVVSGTQPSFVKRSEEFRNSKLSPFDSASAKRSRNAASVVYWLSTYRFTLVMLTVRPLALSVGGVVEELAAVTVPKKSDCEASRVTKEAEVMTQPVASQRIAAF